MQNVGVDVLEACNLVLESENVLESTALGLALARTDDLVEALVDHERDSPDIRNLLANIVTVLADIRSKVEQASRIPELLEECDKLFEAARKLKDKLREVIRSRESERSNATERLVELRMEWAVRAAELQDQLQDTTSLLSAERSKVEAAKITTKELEIELKQWRTSAARYKKKYHALKKEHDMVRNGIEDAFFADDSLRVI